MRRFLKLFLISCLIPGLGRGVRAEDAKAIIDQAIRAHGGQARLDKHQAGYTEIKGAIYQNDTVVSFNQEILYQLPDQVKKVIKVEVKDQQDTITTVFNGDKGWINFGGQTRDLEDKFLTEVKEAGHLERVFRLTSLKEKMFTLSALGPFKIDGRILAGVGVASPGYRDIHLFFDKDSGLLVRSQRQAVDPRSGQEFLEERVITQYGESDGVKIPQKIVLFRDGKKFMDMEVTEVKFVDRVNESVFAKP